MEGIVGQGHGRHHTGLQRARLHAHIGEQIDHSLLHPRVWSGATAVVIAVELPGPLHRTSAEYQCAAPGAI
jgi:hypothetical protein